jgi:hypothetical protein
MHPSVNCRTVEGSAPFEGVSSITRQIVFQALSHFLKLFRHARLVFLDSRLFAGMTV